jgi:hypothetical protein
MMGKPLPIEEKFFQLMISNPQQRVRRQIQQANPRAEDEESEPIASADPAPQLGVACT